MNDLFTLADAVSAVGRFIENGAGVCDQPTVIDRVNEACQRLMVKGDWPFSLVLVRARVDRDTFPLPEELEAIRAVRIDNDPAFVNSSYFRFMAAGPGEERSWIGTGAKSIDEVGLFPTMYDIPSIEVPSSTLGREFTSDGLYIMAFSTSKADAGKVVTVSGLGKYNSELASSSVEHVPTEEVRILPWDGAEGQLRGTLAEKPKSTNAYRQLVTWSKPETAGHVSLYAVEPSTSRMWFLGRAKPFTRNPVWRRYRVRAQCCGGSNILMLGKLAARKLRSVDEILPIQNVPAIKMMVQAIEFENKQQLKGAVEFEAQAIRLLSEQKSDHDCRGPEVNVIDHDPALHGALNSRLYSR